MTTDPIRLVIAVTSSGTFLTAVVALYRVWRAGRTKDRELDLTGDQQLNSHYAAELSALREQLIKTGDNARERANAAEERHTKAQAASDERFNVAMAAAAEREQACEDRVRELRDEVRGLSDEIIGLRRNMGQNSRSAIVLATHTPSLPIQQAADRAADALERSDDRLHNLPYDGAKP